MRSAWEQLDAAVDAATEEYIERTWRRIKAAIDSDAGRHARTDFPAEALEVE